MQFNCFLSPALGHSPVLLPSQRAQGQTWDGILGTLIFKHRMGFLWWETHSTLGEGYSMSIRINVTVRAKAVPNKYVFEEEKLVT